MSTKLIIQVRSLRKNSIWKDYMLYNAGESARAALSFERLTRTVDGDPFFLGKEMRLIRRTMEEQVLLSQHAQNK